MFRLWRGWRKLMWMVGLLGVGAATIAATAGNSDPVESKPSKVQAVTTIDGDTFRLVKNGKRIRVIGVDTPEMSGGPGGGPECGAQLATDYSRQFAANGVRLSKSSETPGKDKYGRLLRYVKSSNGKKDLGKQLLKQGLAVPAYDGLGPGPGENHAQRDRYHEIAEKKGSVC
jgi:endonuclease YncB( thermonuclease family)